MSNDIGESIASINKRFDDFIWPDILTALQGGAVLFRPTGLTKYFTRCLNPDDPNEGKGITATRVKNLEKQGVLIRVGVDTYSLGELPGTKADFVQMSLF